MRFKKNVSGEGAEKLRGNPVVGPHFKARTKVKYKSMENQKYDDGKAQMLRSRVRNPTVVRSRCKKNSFCFILHR